MTEAGEWIDAKLAMVGRMFSPNRTLRVVSAQLGENARYVGIAPTGRPLRFTSCDIFRVKNGQCAEHWGMGEQRAAMRSGVDEARRDHVVGGHCCFYRDLKVSHRARFGRVII